MLVDGKLQRPRPDHKVINRVTTARVVLRFEDIVNVPCIQKLANNTGHFSYGIISHRDFHV